LSCCWPQLVFVSAKTKIDVSGVRAGQSLRVVGFSGRYEQHTELLPRMPDDIAAASNRSKQIQVVDCIDIYIQPARRPVYDPLNQL
jgi:hypothetical protein